MSDVVIRTENLGKKYVIGHQEENSRYVALRDVLIQNAQKMWQTTKSLLRGEAIVHGHSFEEIWALREISFEISQGDVVGIVGHNGAGKSTLLKVLSRITEPTTGRARIRGRVASLLEVGTGFHPELTGRENILLNGTILGMSRSEIKRKFEEIVFFAEIEKFLDTPVKRYSSGMYVRLAFAIAAHLEPDILIVDEVLAVGDAEFQKKCLRKMQHVNAAGRTVLFVSHNMAAVQLLCEKGMLLENGRMTCCGEIGTVMNLYEKARRNSYTSQINPSGLSIRVALSRHDVHRGDSVTLRATFECNSRNSVVEEAAFLIHNSAGIRIGVVDLRHLLLDQELKNAERFTVETRVDTTNLVEDIYTIGTYVMVGDEKFEHYHSDGLVVREPPSRHPFPSYPRHVRGFLELNTESMILEAECGTSNASCDSVADWRS